MNTEVGPDLSVIIVNYNTADFLARCLDSIALQNSCVREVIVVDNASQDDSMEAIDRCLGEVRLIRNEKNIGFARANNQALEICRGRYVHFLNPDTEVVPGAFSSVVEFMDLHLEIGLAGTRILNPDGTLQPSVERDYPGGRHAIEELSGLTGSIAWVLGASMVGRRDVLLTLGGFDERFFVYGEDQDLCLRMRKNGWEIGFISEAVVFHWGGQSERNNLSADVWKRKLQAEMFFYGKHYKKKTIRTIRRNNLAKAFWRILTLKVMLPFSNNKAELLDKLIKYRTDIRRPRGDKKDGQAIV